MWANAQSDGRPAKCRWRPLFNATNFRCRPLLECCAVTLSRRETRWSILGCHKLANRSQPLVARSSPYCQQMWEKHCCLTSFFPIVDTCLSWEDIARQSCAMVPRWRIFGDFLGPTFPASCMQHISDLLRLGEKQKKKTKQDKNIMSASAMQGGHNQHTLHGELQWHRPLTALPSVLWHCWLGISKSIQPIRKWVMRFWHGWLYAATMPEPHHSVAYGPADATATPSSIASLKSRMA